LLDQIMEGALLGIGHSTCTNQKLAFMHAFQEFK
jgi:hypothetical protein